MEVSVASSLPSAAASANTVLAVAQGAAAEATAAAGVALAAGVSAAASSVGHPDPCDPSPDGADEGAYLKVLNFYVIATVSIAGLIANGFIIAVFCTKRRLSSADVFAASLAFYDALVVLAKSMYAHRYAYPYMFAGSFGGSADGVGGAASAVASRIAVAALCVDRVVHLCNTYTIVLLSLDRCARVCHSTAAVGRARRWCTRAVAVRLEIGLLAFAIVYSTPAVYMFAEVLAADPQAVRLCRGYFQFADGQLGLHVAFGYGYETVAYMIVFYLLPLITLCYSNVNLIRIVAERQRFARRAGRLTPLHTGNGSTSEADTERSAVGSRVIATLILVTAIFFFSQLPALADQIVSFSYFNENSFLHIISYDFVLVNCSINCAIYTLSSRTFRRRLCHLLGLSPADRRPPPSSMQSRPAAAAGFLLPQPPESPRCPPDIEVYQKLSSPFTAV